ncbi:MAG: hypothetical protein LIQ30_10620 [Planctomycetes bacterium]|nr:hypothetical protein [Planctomycetota bacterium]MCD7897713.1 hypothetical protein [Planctomycetaceae bacterium]
MSVVDDTVYAAETATVMTDAIGNDALTEPEAAVTGDPVLDGASPPDCQEAAPPEITFTAESVADTDPMGFIANEAEVWSHNLDAMRVETAVLDAFLDLLAAADAEYMDTGDYVIDESDVGTVVDWTSVESALGESQQTLIGLQDLLSNILEEMGVEDYQYLRVFSDADGAMRLVGDHPRREEIEAVLNSPVHHQFRELYQAATNGMAMAGSLVGRVSVPEEVLERYKQRKASAS